MNDLGCRYIGHRRGDRTTAGRAEVFVRKGAVEYMLPMRHDLFNHSPDGFNYGYGGSGPAQLALAILADALRETPLGEAIAVELHQQFKEEVIAQINPANDWGIGREYVLDWIAQAKK